MIRVDLHEPKDAVAQFGQIVPAEFAALNDKGYADYLWEGFEGQYQWERKQWGELTSSLDRVEYQLRQEKEAHPDVRLGLIVEGVATPSFGGVQIWHKGSKAVFFKGREESARYSMVVSWLYQVGKFIEIHYTADYQSTVMALAAFYQSDQKPIHGTFQRHLKTMDWHPNPQVEMLIALGHRIGIGPAKAQELITQFGTVWNILQKSPQELGIVAGIGQLTATRLLRKVGRPDV